jgi:hypothetical protein
MPQKFVTIYPDDFRNINDWYAICDQLGIDYNALLVDVYYNKLVYETQKETNILEQLFISL